MKSEFCFLLFAIFTFICSAQSQTKQRRNSRNDSVLRSSTKSLAGKNYSENSNLTSSPVVAKSSTVSIWTDRFSDSSSKGTTTNSSQMLNNLTTPLSANLTSTSSGYHNKSTTLTVSFLSSTKTPQNASTSNLANATLHAKDSDSKKTTITSRTKSQTKSASHSSTKKLNQSKSTTKLTTLKSISKSTVVGTSTKHIEMRATTVKNTTKKPTNEKISTTLKSTTKTVPKLKNGTTTMKVENNSKKKTTKAMKMISSSNEKYKKQFVSWRKAYKKNYTNSEAEKKAEENFVKEAKDIDAHNNKTDKTYTRKVMKTSDMTYDERVKKRMGLKMSRNDQHKKYSRGKREINDDLSFDRFKRALDGGINGSVPEEVDYRSRFGPIKDQNQCGACWAFTVIGVLEAFFYEKVGVRITLSEQELLDCNT